MNDNELIIQMLTQMQTSLFEVQASMSGMQSDIKELKEGQARLEGRMDALEESQTLLIGRMDDLEEGQAKMSERLEQVEVGQVQMSERLEQVEAGQRALAQTVVNLENTLVPKVTALFDAFSLRGDQIDRLERKMDEQFRAVRVDISYLLEKVVLNEKRFNYLEKEKASR